MITDYPAGDLSLAGLLKHVFHFIFQQFIIESFSSFLVAGWMLFLCMFNDVIHRENGEIIAVQILFVFWFWQKVWIFFVDFFLFKIFLLRYFLYILYRIFVIVLYTREFTCDSCCMLCILSRNWKAFDDSIIPSNMSAYRINDKVSWVSHIPIVGRIFRKSAYLIIKYIIEIFIPYSVL